MILLQRIVFSGLQFLGVREKKNGSLTVISHRQRRARKRQGRLPIVSKIFQLFPFCCDTYKTNNFFIVTQRGFAVQGSSHVRNSHGVGG